MGLPSRFVRIAIAIRMRRAACDPDEALKSWFDKYRKDPKSKMCILEPGLPMGWWKAMMQKVWDLRQDLKVHGLGLLPDVKDDCWNEYMTSSEVGVGVWDGLVGKQKIESATNPQK
jgi:hypothetical protein